MIVLNNVHDLLDSFFKSATAANCDMVEMQPDNSFSVLLIFNEL